MFIPAVFLILKKDSKVFMMQRANTGYEDGHYDFISGHVEDDETPTAAVIREAFEEAGVKVLEKDLNIVHIMATQGGDHERVDFFFQTSKWKNTPHAAEPEKCSNAEWFEIKKLPKDIIKPVKFALDKTNQGTFYSEYGWK